MNSKTKSALCLPFLTVSHPKLYFESTYAYTMGEVICQLLMLLGQAVLEVGCYLTAKLLVPFLTFGKVEQPIRNEIRYYGANAGSYFLMRNPPRLFSGHGRNPHRDHAALQAR